MPVYKVLTKEIVDEWYKFLDSATKLLISSPSEESFSFFLLRLYEYLVVTTGFKIKCKGVDSKDVKLNLGELKQISESEEESRIYLKLKKVADDIRHDPSDVSVDVKWLLKAFSGEVESCSVEIKNIWEKRLISCLLQEIYC